MEERGEGCVCGDHGECRDGICKCDLGYFGKKCAQAIGEAYPTVWEYFNYFMAAAFAFLGALAVAQLVLLCFATKPTGRFRKLMLVTIFLATLIRVVWLLVDPFAIEGRWPVVVERIVFYTADGLIATCSNFVLIFWVLLLRILIPHPMTLCRGPVVLLLVLGNLTVWVLLIAYAILGKTIPDASKVLHDIFAIAFGGYILLWALGLLAIGLNIYISYIRRLGFAYVNSPAIKKVTILALLTSMVLVGTCVTLILSAGFILDYASEPVKFITFQSIFRAEEWILCCIVVMTVGEYDVRSLLSCCCRSSEDEDDPLHQGKHNKDLPINGPYSSQQYIHLPPTYMEDT